MPYKNKETARRKARERYLAKREEILAKTAAYYQKNKVRQQKMRKRWQQRHPDKVLAYAAKYRREKHDQYIAKNRAYKARLRDECFAHYGNKCACCGEHRKEFFAMHHIEGGGSHHRKTEKMLQQGGGIYLWLKRHNYPKNFEIQCHNCNGARGHFGYCPHEREKLAVAESAFPSELYLQH